VAVQPPRTRLVVDGAAPPPAAAERTSAPPPPERSTQPGAGAAADGASDPRAPVIDAVVVEKAEVCEGEENLVSVRAHAPDGGDAWLHYTIAGEAGAQVPVRAWLRRDGTVAPQVVAVFGADNVAARAEVPPYRVKPCRPERLVRVTARLLPNSVEERELTAEVLTHRGASWFVPRRYRWAFGDGATAETDGPVAVHDYAARPQRTAHAQLLASVEVEGEDGERVRGRLALQLPNPAFEARQRGVVALFAQPSPRFPAQSGPDGLVEQRFRLWHAEDGPVEVTRVTVRGIGRGGDPAGGAIELPAAALGAAVIPPGGGIEVPLAHAFAGEPDLRGLVYDIEGRSADGWPARGELALLRPPPAPTQANSRPVTDPALEARIRAALRLLGKPTVSQEELSRLEREGRL
jgi:hypothetical protein